MPLKNVLGGALPTWGYLSTQRFFNPRYSYDVNFYSTYNDRSCVMFFLDASINRGIHIINYGSHDIFAHSSAVGKIFCQPNQLICLLDTIYGISKHKYLWAQNQKLDILF